MSKVREMTFADASKALVAADKKLQAASSADEKRVAALEFADSERVARSAKKRETEGDLMSSILGKGK